MNIVHIKYAIEVAKVGSINKASENLGMAQPNISRAIKDLESDLGISIFDRSAKGMNLTPEGKDFIAYAQKIVSQLNELENMFKSDLSRKQRFSVSAPRAGYIAEAFSKFSHNIARDPAEIVFDETSTYNTINKVLGSDCHLGIIRYDEAADRFFEEMLEESELEFETLAVFKYLVVANEKSVISSLDTVTKDDLREMILITHTDPYAATLSAADVYSRDEKTECTDRCIYILDSAAQLELLSENPDTFMWAAPMPANLLERYNLVQKSCIDNEKRYKDVLIYRKGYKINELESIFVNELKKAAEKYL